MRARTPVVGTIIGVFVVWGGCTERKESIIQSQKERNWLTADSSAITSAEPLEEPKILPQTHFAAARLLEQQGHLQKAIIQYRKAVAVNHSYTAAYNRLGILLGHMGRHADAEKALRQAVELEPGWAVLRNNLGYEYAVQGRWPDAEAELSNAIRLDPQLARAYVNLGMVLSKTQRFEEALEAFNAVLPEADAFYNLGLMFRGQHRYQDATDAFRHVLTLDADFTAASQQLEMIAPRLALASELEPAAGMNRWAVVANRQPADEAVEPTQLAEADTEPAAVVAAAADEDEATAILTSSETVSEVDQDVFDADGNPCPVDEADWMEPTEADDDLDFAAFDIDVWFPGAGAALLPATPELAIEESIAGFDPCFRGGTAVVQWK